MTPASRSNRNGVPDLERRLPPNRVREPVDVSDHEVRRNLSDRADPDSLTPHERLRELTAILANGIHHLRAIPPDPLECREIPAESSQTGLEAVAPTRPYGSKRQPESAMEE